MICLLAREAQVIVDGKALDLPRISQVELKVCADFNGRSYDRGDWIRYSNEISTGVDILFDAAENGSDVAQDFLRAKALEFIQKAGEVGEQAGFPDDARCS